MWNIKKIYPCENCFLSKCELCEIFSSAFGLVCWPFAEGPARYHWPRRWPMRWEFALCVWVYDQEHTVLPPAWLILVRWNILNLDMVIYMIFIWFEFGVKELCSLWTLQKAQKGSWWHQELCLYFLKIKWWNIKCAELFFAKPSTPHISVHI